MFCRPVFCLAPARTACIPLALAITCAAALPGAAGAQGPATAAATYRGASTAVRFDVSPPVAGLAPAAEADPSAAGVARPDDPPSGLEGPPGPQDADPLVQHTVGAGPDMPATLQSFDGIGATGVYPPDPNGEVGPNHYVQMVNSKFAIYNKAGTLLYGPANINTLWSGFGGACETENAGDPIVLYDQFADRWLLTQFTAAGPTYYNCIALSTSGDPTGTYYRWAYSNGTNFPDYPKFAVWRDAYYMSTRDFAGSTMVGAGVHALDRTQMLAGNPVATKISFLAPAGYSIGDGLLPADADGPTLPPAGRPGFFLGSQDNGGPYAAPSDAINIWKFTADFVTPANSTFTLASTIASAAFDSMLAACGGTRNCIPQPGTTQKIDHQGYRQRLLHRAAYRNFGTHESIVTNQSVEVSAMSGIRWWEIRSPNASPVIYQEGTYAPGTTDGIHRWFGSVAQDQSGNMALGYSVSDGSTTYPGIRYTGRLAGDPLGTLPQGEGVIVNGGGSQTGSAARWGDYSSMTVDPADDCTFWYTTEYYATTSATGWKTRIGSFKFPGCSAASLISRTYVASFGNDTNTANSCDATHPCRTLAAAFSRTASGGEILVLDNAGYGRVTLDRSVAIIAAPGAFAGIGVGAGGITGVEINTAGVEIVLRGLTITGQGGSHGIHMTNGSRLSVENCVVSNFGSGSGIYVNTAAQVRVVDSLVRDNNRGIHVDAGATASISGSRILGNSANGILVGGSVAGTATSASVSKSIVAGTGADWAVSAQSLHATASARLRLVRSSVSHAAVGVIASSSSGGTASVAMGGTRVSANSTGLSQSGAGATFRSLGNNAVSDNTVPTAGTITPLAPM